MITPDQIDDLADALDARCDELGNDASQWMLVTFVEALAQVSDPPDWFQACVDIVRADPGTRKVINELANEIAINLEREDGTLISRTIAEREIRAHPFLVLGLDEANRQMILAAVLRAATYGDWGWDAANEVYRLMCEVPNMAERTLATYQKRLGDA